MSFALKDGRNPIGCLKLKSSTGRFQVVDIVKTGFNREPAGVWPNRTLAVQAGNLSIWPLSVLSGK